MDKQYSRIEFEGYTHRFVVEFETNEPYTSTLNIYSKSDSYQELEEFINENKSGKVLSFKIVHRATKEQDDAAFKFLEEEWL